MISVLRYQLLLMILLILIMTVVTSNTTGAPLKKNASNSSQTASKLPCEKYVSFINPNEPNFKRYVRVRKDIPRDYWTISQKNMVDKAIRAMAVSAPGLLQRAMNGAPIPLIVMDNIDESVAVTDTWGISITLDAFKVPQDSFFRMLLHECTHIVDFGSGYSESQRWNDLIVPKIRLYRTYFGTPFSGGEPACDSKKLLLKKLNLPSGFVVGGSDEALAECISFTVLGKYRAPTLIRNFIWTYFLSVPRCINVHQQLEAKAELAYNHADYKTATLTIIKLIRVEPTARAHFLQADIWLDRGELELAHSEYAKAMDCLKAGHVPEFDPIYLKLQANLSKT